MQNICKKLRIWGMILFLTLATTGIVTTVTHTNVQAAVRTGFVTINGRTYYINADGSKHKGWKVINGKRYYFNSSGIMMTGFKTFKGKKFYFDKNGQAAVGWRQDAKGNKRYFLSTGQMCTGWGTVSGNRYYFEPSTGIVRKGWLTYQGNKYYLNMRTGVAARNVLTTDVSRNITRYFTSSGRMYTGYLKNSKNQVRYFDPKKDGAMAKGFYDIDGKTYYFYTSSGFRVTGWLRLSGKKYYLNPDKDGELVKNGSIQLDGYTYTFDRNGVLVSSARITPTPTPSPTPMPSGNVPDTVPSTGTKTLKNYLAGAIEPVGQALYVWGGGWTDATRKGVSPTWKQWYDTQSPYYDYNNYRDLSAANRAKGLDCSGFVGWAAYQVMQKQSGVGSGYTVVSGDVGSYYKSMGWGAIISQANLASKDWKLYPGDVGYNSGHTWIVIGQCKDKSAVIVHSTPQAGCQIAGTCTPDGQYESEAIQLARKYMSKYYGYAKYDYHTSSGNYVRNGNYLRWNRDTLADPEGIAYMTADQILYQLFGF